MECNNFSPNVVEYTVPVYIIHTWKPSMNHSRGKGSRWCGLYRHNDWRILHPAHLPHSQALAAFITCKFVNVQIFGHKAAVHLSFQHHNHSLTIIYTPFYSAQSSGVGHILIARLWYILSCYPTTQGRIERMKDRGLRVLLLPCGGPAREPGRVSLHSPQSSSTVLSAALHDTPGAGCGDCGTHTSHRTQSGWRESGLAYTMLEKRFALLLNTPVHYTRGVFRTHSGMFKQDPRLLICPTNKYYSIVT